MYDDKYHFITFTLFSSLLSGFGFEIVIPEPDPIRISGLIFRSEPDLFVKDLIGFSNFRVLFTILVLSKKTKVKFSIFNHRTKGLLDLIYMDVWGSTILHHLEVIGTLSLLLMIFLGIVGYTL